MTAPESSCPAPVAPDDAACASLADLFKHLSDPRRLSLLMHLAVREHSVTELAACLGVTVSAVSHQLAGLRRARLVAARRSGQQVFHRLHDDHVSRLVALGLEHVRETEP